MQLHWSPRSPYVRKVMVVVHELGLANRIELIRSVAVTTQPNPEIMAVNPLNKIPTLVLEDGHPLYDSRVICEYLAHLSGRTAFFRPDDRYFETLRRQALGDGLLDVMIAWRGEQLRPLDIRSAAHERAFRVKLDHCLALLEGEAEVLAQDPYDIGHVAIGCALAYVDFRFADRNWKADHARLARWHDQFEARPAVLAAPIIDD